MICSIVVASLLFYNLFLFFTPIQTLPSHHRSVNSLLILNTFFFGVKVHFAQYTDAKYRRWAAAAAAAGFLRRRVCNKTSCHLSLRRERFYKRCRLGLERAREELSEGCLSRGDLDINMWKKLRRFLSSAPSIQRFSEPRQQCVAECLRKSVFFFLFFPLLLFYGADFIHVDLRGDAKGSRRSPLWMWTCRFCVRFTKLSHVTVDPQRRATRRTSSTRLALSTLTFYHPRNLSTPFVVGCVCLYLLTGFRSLNRAPSEEQLGQSV